MTARRHGLAHAQHDHDDCLADALRQAEELCVARGERLTPLRRQVLELVWSSHRPRGAYALLEELAAKRGPVAPPTVYRSLEFLLAQGLIHRIQSLNAYIGCPVPRRRHASQFFICGRCGETAELHDQDVSAAIDRGAEGLGFRVERETVEVQGLCAACRAEPEA